jgi:cytochrome c oxidase subunit I
MEKKRLLSVFIILLAISLLPDLIIWLHHRFVFGFNPILNLVIMTILFSIVLFFLIKWFRWLKKRQFSISNPDPVMLFVMGALCWIIPCMLHRNSTIDIHLYDTYYIISVSLIAFCIAIVFAMFGVMYDLFSKIFRRHLNTGLGFIHFWITFIGLNLLRIGHAEIITSKPWRYVEFNGATSYNQAHYLNIYVLVVLDLVLAAQFIFPVNILSVFFARGKS